MAQEIITTVPPLVIDYLPLEGELQDFFRPSAKQKIQLVNQQGQTILCRVNARATLLKGTGLANFLAAILGRRLAFVALREQVVLVCPAEARRPASGSTSAASREHTSGAASIVPSQASSTRTATGEHASQPPKEEPAKATTGAANPRSTHQANGKTPVTAGNPAKAGTTTPIEPPTPNRKKAGTPPGAQTATATLTQLTLFPDAGRRNKPVLSAPLRGAATSPGGSAGLQGSRSAEALPGRTTPPATTAGHRRQDQHRGGTKLIPTGQGKKRAAPEVLAGSGRAIHSPAARPAEPKKTSPGQPPSLQHTSPEHRSPSSQPGSPTKARRPLPLGGGTPTPAPVTSPGVHPNGSSQKKLELTPAAATAPAAPPVDGEPAFLPAGTSAIMAAIQAVKTGELKKLGEAPATRPAVEVKETAAAAVPLVVHFAPEEDKKIIAALVRGQVAPAADLFLHRQALLLSLSSGFDTLLSLAVVRDVQPLDYQLATVRHVLKNMRGRALLCDEVGMGKTIEAGLILMEYLLRGLVRRVLVLTPPSLVEQWQQEMQVKFNLDFISYDAPAFKAAANPWLEFPHIIASVDTAKRPPHRELVLASEFDLVVVDEAHHLKNKHTQAYQLVSRLKKKYILLLTATPVENNMEELFNLITLLLPGQLETAASFKRKYITRGEPLKPKNTEALKRLLREVMVRNRRSETGVIRSRRRADTVELTLSPEEMAFYNRLTSFVRGYYTPQAQQTTSGVNQFILRTLQREVGSSIDAVLPTLEKMAANPVHPEPLRRLLQALAVQGRAIKPRAKVDVLVKLLRSIKDKVIVFTSFQETQALLARWLRQEGFPVAELHGQMRRQEKEDQVRLFAGEARVLVSTENGSEGRNLQFCRFLVNYDLPWNPMRIEQRIGRIHRLGQERDVQIYNLAAAGTVEAYILELLDAKINMFQLVVGELDMILGTLHEKKDFEDLVMEVWANAADEEDVRAGMDNLGQELLAAKVHYQAVKALDERLLGELLPDE